MKSPKKIIVVANQKGGVGKTTTALNLQSLYQLAGFKTLMIDLETQGNNTHVHKALVKDTATAYDIFVDNKDVGDPERLMINDAIQHTEFGDIVAHDPLLAKADAELSSNVNGNFVIADAINELDDYDIVIIDTAPALNRLLMASLIAATHVIIPLNQDEFSLEGLAQLNRTINEVRRRQNPDLIIEGLLVSRVGQKTNLAKAINKNIIKAAEKIGTKVFNSCIRECVKTKEAQAYKISLFEYDKNCTTAHDYINLFNELENIDLNDSLFATKEEKQVI